MPLSEDALIGILSGVSNVREQAGKGIQAGLEDRQEREAQLLEQQQEIAQEQREMTYDEYKAAKARQLAEQSGLDVTKISPDGVSYGDTDTPEGMTDYQRESLKLRKKEMEERVERNKRKYENQQLDIRDIDRVMIGLETYLPEWWLRGEVESSIPFVGGKTLNEIQQGYAEQWKALNELRKERIGMGGRDATRSEITETGGRGELPARGSRQRPVKFRSKEAATAADLPIGTHIEINGQPAVIE